MTLAVRLEARVRRAGALWVAACPPLDVVTQADTQPEALAALREAVEAWFESCVERGVLDAALREAGFAPS
ncbi:MAG: type II toxin-antitoxin system HicB family antitoxin [Acidobacteria bacterium]|nr:type II toxin-antitoxin system HicB family antitoxin [Acidobacteriota bacterium]